MAVVTDRYQSEKGAKQDFDEKRDDTRPRGAVPAILAELGSVGRRKRITGGRPKEAESLRWISGERGSDLEETHIVKVGASRDLRALFYNVILKV